MLRQLRASGQALRLAIGRPADESVPGPFATFLTLTRRGWFRECTALLVLFGLVLVQFRDVWRAGLAAYEKDTLVFFYPLERWFASEFQAGRFPLWNPYVFAGYPGFADGEIGMAYPLHLLFLRLFTADQAFLGLRVSCVLIATWGAYGLCRSLAVGRLPALAGGVVFGFGSFFVSQQHHDNVIRTAAWLPMIMACVEWALRRAGWRRHMFLTLGGVALAMAALGLHPQVLGMTLLGFSTFVGYRVLFVPVGGRDPGSEPGDPRLGTAGGISPRSDSGWRGAARAACGMVAVVARRVGLLLWVGTYVGVLGLGLASVQLVPLAELGLATYRGSAPDYFFATSYALPMHNLVGLVFPYFFRGPESEYWSLWARWENALYVGVGPLLLGLLGVVLARRRVVGYFVLLALTSLWLAFASYAPFDLYSYLWQLPGFSAFRVPGRYTYLFVLAWSVLTAFGLQALMAIQQPGRTVARRVALVALLLLGAGVAAGFWMMSNLRESLAGDPTAAGVWLRETYLAVRQQPGGVNAADVYRGMLHSLDVANPRTFFALLVIVLTLALATGWALLRRAHSVWAAALLAVVVVDLVAYGASFHQKLPIGEIVEATPAIRFLQERQVDSAASWRVYTPGESVPSMEHNRLVPFRLEDIGGYSSAEPRENFAYWTTVRSLENRLLDIANVRYLVAPRAAPSLPSYRNVPFDPERPLLLGGRDSLGGTESYSFGGVTGHRVQVVAGLSRAVTIPQGDPVVELLIVPTSGAPATRTMRAGIHVAEWAYDRPDIAGRILHQRPAEVAFQRPDTFLLDGSRYELIFSYAEFDLPSEMTVDRIEIRYVHEQGGMELYGLGIYNFQTRQTTGATQSMRTSHRLVYQDAEARISENANAFPRAYVVPGARVPPEGKTPLSAMLDTVFDPTTEVMLDAPLAGAPPAAGGILRHGPPGGADRVDDQGDEVRIDVTAPSGGVLVHVAAFAPGWRAWVDGREAPVVRGNALFRAVVLPPGAQHVVLRYEPLSVELGRWGSLWAACGALAVVLGAVLAAALRGHRRIGPV